MRILTILTFFFAASSMLRAQHPANDSTANDVFLAGVQGTYRPAIGGGILPGLHVGEMYRFSRSFGTDVVIVLNYVPGTTSRTSFVNVEMTAGARYFIPLSAAAILSLRGGFGFAMQTATGDIGTQRDTAGANIFDEKSKFAFATTFSPTLWFSSIEVGPVFSYAAAPQHGFGIGLRISYIFSQKRSN